MVHNCCKFEQVHPNNGDVTHLTCWDLRVRTAQIDPDELANLLALCTCLTGCKKCPMSEHEGVFCRCEDRNMLLSKQRRRMKRGKS